jgi:hypothetical protein
MYCSACGAESTQGLNYCKRCGTNLGLTAALDNQPSKPRNLTGMVWAVAMMTATGFATLFGAVIALAALGVREADLLGPITIFGSLSIVAVAALLVRFLSRVAGLPDRKEARREKRRAGPDYGPSQIPAAPDYIPSVTEHTTHVFDPSERKEPNSRG